MKKSEFKKLSGGEQQRLLQEFVDREVIYMVSPLINELMERDDLSIYDSLVNLTEDEDGIYPDIYEWYIVSEWLADRLEEQGEIIANDFLGLTIWGRQTTGQAIMLDSVIEKIYQKYMLE